MNRKNKLKQDGGFSQVAKQRLTGMYRMYGLTEDEINLVAKGKLFQNLICAFEKVWQQLAENNKRPYIGTASCF